MKTILIPLLNSILITGTVIFTVVTLEQWKEGDKNVGRCIASTDNRCYKKISDLADDSLHEDQKLFSNLVNNSKYSNKQKKNLISEYNDINFSTKEREKVLAFLKENQDQPINLFTLVSYLRFTGKYPESTSIDAIERLKQMTVGDYSSPVAKDYLAFKKHIDHMYQNQVNKAVNKYQSKSGTHPNNKQREAIKARTSIKMLEFQHRYLSCRTTRKDAYRKEALKSFVKFQTLLGLPITLSAFSWNYYRNYGEFDDEFKSQFSIEFIGAILTTFMKIMLYPNPRLGFFTKTGMHYGFYASMNYVSDPLILNEFFNPYDRQAQEILNRIQNDPKLLEEFHRFIEFAEIHGFAQNARASLKQIFESNSFENQDFNTWLQSGIINDPMIEEHIEDLISIYLYESTALGPMSGSGNSGLDRWHYGLLFGASPLGSVKSVAIGMAIYQMLCMYHDSPWAWLAATTIYTADNFIFNSWYYQCRETLLKDPNGSVSDCALPPNVFDLKKQAIMDPYGLKTHILQRP